MEKKYFSHCKFCKLNHNTGVNHVYSNRHKKNVKFLYKKFKSKIKHAKSEIEDTVIMPEIWENGKTFWCLFCEEENSRHLHVFGATIKNYNFLKHLSMEQHALNADKFWKQQRIRHQLTARYCISEELFKKFAAMAAVKVEEYIAEKQKEIKHKAEILRYQEENRKLGTCVGTSSEFNIEDIQQLRNAKTIIQNDPNAPKGFRTIAAKAEGLTCITIPNLGKDRGNVHSGAKPPWLRDDGNGEISANTPIGPTTETYKKHLECERKRKLPAGRVGANFSETGVDANWMPSFGRVWSKNTRKNQRKWVFAKKSNQSATPAEHTVGNPLYQHQMHNQLDTLETNEHYEQQDLNLVQNAEYCEGGNGYMDHSHNHHTSSSHNERLGYTDKLQDSDEFSNNFSYTQDEGLHSGHESLQNISSISTSVQPYVKKRTSYTNNVGIGRINIADNLL